MDNLEQIRKITVTGRGTYSMTLPKGMVKGLKWRKGQKVVVERDGDKLIIRDFKPGADQ
jgi:antitoxin component of MazEF toxin-antitoxin module